MKNKKFFKKILSVIICVALLMSYLPTMLSAAAAESGNYNKIVDVNTMDGWMEYFPLRATANNPLTTANAGGVWTDKTVLSAPTADFSDNGITMIDEEKNFLTVLSSIAANKEVVGYSTVPTDTVLVLDVSGSMDEDEVDLVAATNAAITKLLATNNNNRVGVVLYSASRNSGSSTYAQSVIRLLPIGRYTTRNGQYLVAEDNNVSVSDNVRIEGQSADPRLDNEKNVVGGTYIQAGLWEAYKMFDEIPDNDVYIGDNNWQEGQHRMPIVVLMSDGAPTTGTTHFDNVEGSYYTVTTGNIWNQRTETVYGSNVGDGYDTDMTAGQGFLVQLTASYIKNRIENKYKVHEENGTGRSLFYTLGFNLSYNNDNRIEPGDIAYNVLNPDATTITDSLWNTYNRLTANNNTMEVNVRGRNGNNTDVTITRNSYATSKSYVDEFFSASGDGLTSAFDDIVEEIILQSRYYPTHLEGGSPDFSGYVEFTDILGDYMEVKHINGFLLGDVLFDGHMMASKIADTSSDGLGTPEAPTALGDEFIRAVKTRLGIADTAEAQNLVAAAYEAEQLCYVEDNRGNLVKWSNYIGWFADASGNFIGHWNERPGQAVPAGAVYKIKSYGFLGETHGSIKNSDMMYMSVQVKQNIETGQQTVSWKIPAALVPMITYLVEVDGTSIDTATNVRLAVEDENAAPIRLVYETGLRSDLNEFNITRITGEDNLAADGHTRVFWNNYFDISGNDHTAHKTTLAEFTPNKENERFYYTFDSAVHKKADTESGYAIVGQNETPDPNGEYYHRRFIFSSATDDPIFFYERMSSKSIEAAVENGWQADFESLEHETVGAWVVPAGTPARELQMYEKHKAENLTDSADMIFYPYLTEQNELVYIDMNLGNNGLLSVTPATGIKISKTVDIFEEGTSDSFRFRITASESGTFESWITDIGATPSGEATNVTLRNGVYEFDLSKDQTFWLTGLSAGATYTVEEISDNDDYKIKSVHVNEIASGTVGRGTVTQYFIDDVHFVNTAIGEGDLVITKRVVDSTGNTVDVNDSLTFTAEVTLTDAAGRAVSGTFDSTNGRITVGLNGKFTVRLKDGASFIVRGIPEETRYTVTETNIPVGFALNTAASTLSGVVDASTNDQAIIVNTYAPVGTDGNGIGVEVIKQISGNRTEWQNGESYTFNLELVRVTRDNVLIDTKTISYNNTDKKALFSLSGEDYDAAGTYTYRIYEETGTQGGITYDTADRRFSVVVADSDMDGDLEVVNVTNELNTIVSGNWTVNANFNNVYAPTGSATATINIQKAINANHSLAGFQFALYNADPFAGGDVDELLRSNITGADGRAVINLNYAANRATIDGVTYTYYLAEIVGTNPNITYSEQVYEVKVTVRDNGDGTISAVPVITGLAAGNAATFTNTYTPSASDFVTLSGKKVISTGNRILNAGEFSFELEGVGNAPMPAVTVVKNAADGSFSFDAIEFTAVGEYTYYITEVDTDRIGGFTYDQSKYTVTVKVDDNGDATLTANVISITRGTASATDILFENEYRTTPATVSLAGTKHLTGKNMRGGEFEFEIRALTNGAPLPANTVAVNGANGAFAFETITYTDPGRFVYTVTEKQGSDTRYTYDRSVYTVTVVVTDNSEGRLSATYTMTKNNMSSGEIVFSNSFTPDAIPYNIYTEFGGEKTLEGREIEDGEFEFKLINAVTGEQIGETVRNDADGKIEFPELLLHSEGTYHYKISEVIGDENGITYDPVVYHVVVRVAQIDDENSSDDGKLTIARSVLFEANIVIDETSGTPQEKTEYTDITAEGSIAFVNSYKAAPADIVLEGDKILTGRALKEGEFTFNLYHAVFNAEAGKWEKGDLVEQVQNDAEGKFAFETRISEEDATYIYFITEDATDPDPTITYDTTEYMIFVTSSDNYDGTRYIAYEYTADGEDAETVVFTNTYTAPPTPPEIPETGDSAHGLWLWMALAFVSSLGIFTTGFFALRKNESK